MTETLCPRESLRRAFGCVFASADRSFQQDEGLRRCVVCNMSFCRPFSVFGCRFVCFVRLLVNGTSAAPTTSLAECCEVLSRSSQERADCAGSCCSGRFLHWSVCCQVSSVPVVDGDSCRTLFASCLPVHRVSPCLVVSKCRFLCVCSQAGLSTAVLGKQRFFLMCCAAACLRALLCTGLGEMM